MATKTNGRKSVSALRPKNSVAAITDETPNKDIKVSNVHSEEKDKSTEEEMYKYINLRIPFNVWVDLRNAATARCAPGHTVTVTGLINEILSQAMEAEKQ